MNELFPDLRAIALWLLGVIVMLFGFIGRRHLKDFDELKKNAVTRAELERMHQENGNKLDTISEDVSSTRTRVDDLFKFLAGR